MARRGNIARRRLPSWWSALLVALLVWQVVRTEQGGARREAAAGEEPAARPFSTFDRARRRGQSVARAACAARPSYSTSGPPGAGRARRRRPTSSRLAELARPGPRRRRDRRRRTLSSDARRFIQRYGLTYPACVTRTAAWGTLRPDGFPGDLVRRPARASRRRALRGAGDRPRARSEHPRRPRARRWTALTRRRSCVALGAGRVPAAQRARSSPTLAELEREVICPTCQDDRSTCRTRRRGPDALFIRARIAGRRHEERDQVEARRPLRARHPRRPAEERLPHSCLAAAVAGLVAGAAALAAAAWHWSRVRAEAAAPAGVPSANGRRPLDPELERRLDEELARFDAEVRRSVEARSRSRFSAGFSPSSRRASCRSSPATCRPVSGGQVGGGRAAASWLRASRSSPGSQSSSSPSGRWRRGASGASWRPALPAWSLASSSSCSGFAFMGLLPFPGPTASVPGARRGRPAQRFARAPWRGLRRSARRRASVPVLASILALASERSPRPRAPLLLLVYSAGLAVPFLLAGMGFVAPMSASAGSATTTARPGRRAARAGRLGLLLFFDRFWWLNSRSTACSSSSESVSEDARRNRVLPRAGGRLVRWGGPRERRRSRLPAADEHGNRAGGLPLERVCGPAGCASPHASLVGRGQAPMPSNVTLTREWRRSTGRGAWFDACAGTG